MIALLAAALVVTNIVPLDREFATRAGELEKGGLAFDKVFAQLCQRALDQGDEPGAGLAEELDIGRMRRHQQEQRGQQGQQQTGIVVDRIPYAVRQSP